MFITVASVFQRMGPRALVLVLLVGWCGRELATATPVYADQHDAAPPSHPDPRQPVPDHQNANSPAVVTQEGTPAPHVSTQTATPSTALHVQSHAVNGVHHVSPHTGILRVCSVSMATIGCWNSLSNRE
uniref:Secreted peptide n=1 Tax=Rhipicephalus pulchellus TaxID=72859 RepID=L7LVL4_RHIPC